MKRADLTFVEDASGFQSVDHLGAVSGFTDDLIEFGIMGAGATVGVLVWDAVAPRVLGLIPLPAGIAPFVEPLAQIAAGVFLGPWVASNVHKQLGMGVGVGLAASGVSALFAGLAPGVFAGVTGLGRGDDRAIESFLNAAPTDVELLDEFSGAPVDIEDASNFALAGIL